MGAITFTFDSLEQLPRSLWGHLVKVRAGYQCEECESRKGLVAHHRDRNPENNSLANGSCLCRSCHNKKHWADEEHRVARLEAISEGQARLTLVEPGWQARGWKAKTHEERSAAAKLGWERRRAQEVA